MTNGKPPFRADHVGSLLRPPELLRAREQRQQGKISAEALRAIEDRSIRDVAKLQEEIGLQGITDGEYRRTIWHGLRQNGTATVRDHIEIDVVFLVKTEIFCIPERNVIETDAGYAQINFRSSAIGIKRHNYDAEEDY